MSKPVARTTIYFSKLFAAGLSLFVTVIAVGISSLIALRLFNAGESYQLSHVLKLLATVPIFQLVFFKFGNGDLFAFSKDSFSSEFIDGFSD